MKAPKNIIDIIMSNKTSLGDNPALPPELEDKFLVSLVNKHYEKISSDFGEVDVEQLKDELNHLITKCQKLESDSKESLEKLCGQIINKLFLIPNDTIDIDMKIVPIVDTKQERMFPESSEGFSFDNIEDMRNLTSEIYKRRFLNSLIVGASIYYSSMTELYIDELSHINLELADYYKRILALNEILLFHTKQESKEKQTDGGKVDVYISRPEHPVRIKSEGLLFPILLEETIKGLLELSIAHGLPKDKDKAKYITSKADFKLAEIWDQRLGVPLWEIVLNVIENLEENPIDCGLNFIFMELSQLKPSKFNVVMQEILANTKSGSGIMQNILDKIAYSKEQDDFNDYMNQQKQDNQYALNDEEFTSDELLNDDLCAMNILDEEY